MNLFRNKKQVDRVTTICGQGATRGYFSNLLNSHQHLRHCSCRPVRGPVSRKLKLNGDRCRAPFSIHHVCLKSRLPSRLLRCILGSHGCRIVCAHALGCFSNTSAHYSHAHITCMPCTQPTCFHANGVHGCTCEPSTWMFRSWWRPRLRFVSLVPSA